MTPNKQTENGPVIQSDWLDYAELSKQCRAELNVPAGAPLVPLVPSRFIMWLISKLNTRPSQPAVVVGWTRDSVKNLYREWVESDPKETPVYFDEYINSLPDPGRLPTV